MPIKDLKNWLPEPEQILKNRSLKLLAPHLSDPRLWHFNRRSLSKAVYIGVICCFLPLPAQMLIALIFCLYIRANVPMAIGLTWITNPITTIPIYYFAYWLGTLITDSPMITLDVIRQLLQSTKEWMFSGGSSPGGDIASSISLSTFFIGLSVLAFFSSLISGMAFNWAWRRKTEAMWKKREGYKTPEELLAIKNRR